MDLPPNFDQMVLWKKYFNFKLTPLNFLVDIFPFTTQIALFWPKLLPALFLKKP
jgi:hypothetical protein